MRIPEYAPGHDGLSFTRDLVLRSAHALKSLGHNGLDTLLLGWNLPDIKIRQQGGLEARANALAEYAFANPTSLNAERQRVDVAIVIRAASLIDERMPSLSGELNDLRFHLEQVGFSFGEEGSAPPPTSSSIVDNAYVLLRVIARETGGGTTPVIVDQLRNLPMTREQARAAFRYLEERNLIYSKFSMPYSGRLSASGHDWLRANPDPPENEADVEQPAAKSADNDSAKDAPPPPAPPPASIATAVQFGPFTRVEGDTDPFVDTKGDATDGTSPSSTSTASSDPSATSDTAEGAGEAIDDDDGLGTPEGLFLHDVLLVPLPGYDPMASFVLKLGWLLSEDTPSPKSRVLTVDALFVATIEAQPSISDGDFSLRRAFLETLEARHNAANYEAKRNAVASRPEPTQIKRRVAAFTLLSGLSNESDVETILNDAQQIARQTTGQDEISFRHLLVAQIMWPNGFERREAADWFGGSEDLDRLRERFSEIISEHFPDDLAQAWRSLIALSAQPIIASALSDSIPDDPRRVDALGLRRYSDAFAALIASVKQEPPLSLAIFGPWGSGKSFFMGMVQAAVDDFAKKVRQAAAPGNDGRAQQSEALNAGFLSRIVQIRFNAWHYVDGNLWASLVQAILEGLEREFGDTEEQSSFERLVQQLARQGEVTLDVEKRLAEARAKADEARTALTAAQTVSEEKKAAERDLTGTDVLGGFQKKMLDEIRPATNSPQAWIQTVGDSLERAANYIGRPELAAELPALRKAARDASASGEALREEVGKVKEVLDQAIAAERRGGALFTWLANSRMAPGWWRVPLILGLSGFVVLALFTWFLERAGGPVLAAIFGAVSILAPIASFAAKATIWARENIASASKAFGVLEGLRDQIESKRAERLARFDTERLVAHQASVAADAEVEKLQLELQAAEAEKRRMEAERKAAGATEQMKLFVSQRLADGSYRQHLGLVHAIRADMERLGTLLKSLPEKGGLENLEPPIQRIVLYIDDLDRCPPDIVVQVLEAVHLLLAFPLFVVVVGVDIRWVSQALGIKYPEQLGASTSIASPIDYLEKVFQIPFWLPPMDSNGARRLLEAAIGTDGLDVTTAQASGVWTGRGIAEPGQRRLRGGGGDTVESGRFEPAMRDQIAMVPDALPSEGGGDPPIEPESLADALSLTYWERTLLLEMAAAIGISPRRVKRFANLYRILKASLSAGDRRRFASPDGPGQYPVPLMLLASATGAPDATAALITALDRIGDSGVGPQQQSPTLVTLLDSVCPIERERKAFMVVRLRLIGLVDDPGTLRQLRAWAPSVRRFLFTAEGPATATSGVRDRDSSDAVPAASFGT
jgi:KAP family P-loop domain